MKTTSSPSLRTATYASTLAATTLLVGGCDSPESFLGGSLLTISIIGLAALALIIYAVFDLISSPKPLVEKLIWGAVICIVPFIGALAYLFIGR